METSPDEADVMQAILSAGDRAAAFEKLIGELRPKLHRYSARMTGSVIDGEDVLQDALAKAVEALWVHPLILGSGTRLFPDNGHRTRLKLKNTKTRSSGVVGLIFEPGFDPTAFRFTRMHDEIEAYIKRSGLSWTHLRPSQFMQVYLREAPSIAKAGVLELAPVPNRAHMSAS
jgi:uncharacterized protein YbjT (DUF2867 family)